MTSENPHAGQGPVVVDIGGDVGALVVVMPESLIEAEVEIAPEGEAQNHSHGHTHDHSDGHDHDHDHDHPHLPHVAVVPRPMPDGRVVPTLVFGSVHEGRYDLYVRPDGPVQLTVEIVGGQVTEASWPDV